MTSDIQQSIRPWGRYDILDSGEGYQVKRITVQPGQRLSYQRHEHRTEHWLVVAGSGRVVLDGRQITLNVGETILIPQRAKHRMCNEGPEQLMFIEVQLGDYLGEDDIERFQDDYGR